MYHLAVHGNVVKLEDYFETQLNFYLCFELHQKSNLWSLVFNLKKQVREQDVRSIFFKIARAIEHLHDQSIIIRNLETSSILMAEGFDLKKSF